MTKVISAVLALEPVTHLRLTHMKIKTNGVRTTLDETITLTERIGAFSTTQYSLVAPPRTSHLPSTHLRGEVDKRNLRQLNGIFREYTNTERYTGL